ncbi:MAG: GNAT family N-acetyltransferase [Spirochaetota bacterium]
MRNSIITFRETLVPEDITIVREITESTAFFHPAEIETALELVAERLAKGVKSGYFFLFAEVENKTRGYSCFGPIACTQSSYDLFWIAVHRDYRGRGLGKELLKKSEEVIKGLGGTRIYVETSSRELYRPTRLFYEARGYVREAVLEDFYAPGDSKVVYLKTCLSGGCYPEAVRIAKKDSSAM